MAIRDRFIARLGAHRAFWRASRFLERARFKLARLAFQLRHGVHEKTLSAASLPYLLRNGVLPVLGAVAVLALCEGIDTPLQQLKSSVHWPSLESDSYDVLLEAVAAVTGVFLALYFTAISAVAAGVYLSVPHDLRALIVRDRLGSSYVTGVAFTMATTLILLVAHVTADRVYELAPLVVAALAAYSIFAFISLGQRAFFLADPTLLSATLNSDFAYWLKRASATGLRWTDPTFQEHYRRQARGTTEIFATLLAIARSHSHLRGESGLRLVSNLGKLLAYYLHARIRIPTKSRWFGQRPEHKQWYLTDSTEVEMATRTARGLEPRIVPDTTWVEDHLLPGIIDLIELELTERRLDAALSMIQTLPPVWSALGTVWSSKQSRDWLEKLTAVVLRAGLRAPSDTTTTESPFAVAIADALAYLPLSTELAFHIAVDNESTEALGNRIQDTDWTRPGAPFLFRLPPVVTSALEEIHVGKVFEQAISSSREVSTPGWYAKEVALAAYERGLHAEVESLAAFLPAWYLSTAKRLSEVGAHDASGAILSRGLELAWKWERHLNDWRTRAESCRREPLRVQLRRPLWDWEKVTSQIREFRLELLRRLADAIPAYPSRPASDAIPDYLGAAVHFAGESCFDALLTNDDALFATLFPRYLFGLFVIIDRIREKVATWGPDRSAIAISEPVVDALELSGCALILSELHGTPALWSDCQKAWRPFLDGEQGAGRLRFLGAAHAHQRGVFAITHRSILRVRWEQNLSSAVGRLPRDKPRHRFGEGE